MSALVLLMVGASLLWWVIKAIARPEMERRAAIEANARLATEIAAFAAAHKKCPRCAEMVKAEALVCRFCGNDFPAPKPTLVVENAAPRPITEWRAPDQAAKADIPKRRLGY